jgi:hypothetical protein
MVRPKRRTRRQRDSRALSSRIPCLIEVLETRQLLSASSTVALSKLTADPTFVVVGAGSGGATPNINPASVSEITPSEMQTAYGVNLISFGAVAGSGAGQTIAIIDAYNDPDIISDTNTFSQTYGLPQFNVSGGPTLEVLNENGGTALPSNAAPGQWDVEESLDVQWAHAIAPQANIILFEATTSGLADLYSAAMTAANTPGVSVVSMSWGGPEFSYESAEDSSFSTPSGHPGVTFLASTGDSGAPAEYPAYSPNVIAVGGTVLDTDSNGDYLGESAWSDSGGGISQFESQPVYQTGKVNGTSSTNRTAPDVSIDGGTGVDVLDSFDGGWREVAGTSLSCPMWAGLISIVDQGRALAGLSSLDGATQTLPMLYNLPSSDFNEITTGNNGYPATTGYNLASGLGTPIANLLVPDMVARSPLASSPATSTVSQNSSLTFSTSDGNAISVADGFAGSGTDQLSLSVVDGSLTLAAGSGVTVTGGANGSGSLTIQGTLTQLNSALNGLVYTPKAGYSGTDSLIVSYADSVGGGDLTASTTVAITVNTSGNQAPAITSSNKVTFTVGTAGSFAVTATGSPSATFSESGTLPTGLTFNSTTGALSGTPGAGTGGTYTVTFTASNGVGTPASQSFTLTIDQAPAITSANNVTFTVGTAGSFTVAASGFPVDTFSESGTLPTGLTFNTSTGVLSGTPAAGTGGTYTVTFTASNGVGTQASQSFTLTINQAPTITSANNVTFTIGTAGSFTVTASGFPAATFSETGTLPTGLSFNSSTGVLSGTPGAGMSGTYPVTFAASNGVGTQASQSFTLTIDQGAASKLSITQTPTTGTAGQALGAALKVAVEDSSGDVLTSNTSTVTVAVASGPGALANGSTASVAAVSGVATFSSLIFNTAGTYTLNISDGSLTGATTATITVSPGAASKLLVTQTPANSTAGQALSTAFEVAVEDAFGNVVTSNTSTVAAAVASGPGYAASGSTSVAAVSGVATFSNLIFDTEGTYTLSVSDGSLTGATSGSFTVSAAAAGKLVITQTPTTGTAGQALGTALTVAVEDAFGNVVTSNTSTVALTVASGSGAFASGSTTSVAVANGVATFSNLVFDTAETYTLGISDGSLTGATSGSFTVSPAAANKLAITQTPTSGTAGQALGTALQISVEDAFGNVITSNTSTIAVTVASGPGAFASGSTTSVAAASGVATFSNLILDTAASYTLSVSDGSLTGATSGSLTVSPAAASKLAITQTPTSGTAGQALGTALTVAVEDAFGNVITSNSSTVALTVASGPGGFASGSTTSVAAVNGVATFSNLIFDTAGSYTLSLSDGSLTGGASGSCTVSPAAASTLSIMQTPAAGSINQALSPSLQVLVEDQFGNVVTSNSSTITVAMASGPGGFASGSTLSAAAVKGVATFSNLMLNTAGTYTLSVSDGSLTGATSPSIAIGSTGASLLAITQTPTTGTAGQALSTALTVAIETASGDIVTSNTSTIAVSVASGPGGFAGGSTTSVAAVNGVATFSNLIFDAAGTYTLSLSGGSLTGATSATMTISPAAVSKLVLTQTPPTGTAGQALSPSLTVALEDAFGNVVTSNTSTVTVAVGTGPGAFASASATSVDAVNGVATFSNLIFNTAGSYTLSVEDGSLAAATSGSIAVSPAAASKLVMTQAPTVGTAGQALTLTVAVEDAFGNVVTGNSSMITVTPAGPAGFASGSTASVAAINGVATFSTLVLDAAGTYTVSVSDGSLTSATSGSLTISAGAASKLFVSSAPVTSTAGSALNPGVTVTVQDAYGNAVISSTSTITLAVGSGPGSFGSGSTLTTAAVKGVATFSNLILDAAGSYAFSASANSLTSATSTTVTVNPAAASKLFVSQAPATATAGQAINPAVTVSVEDAYGNAVTSSKSTITLAVSSGPGAFASGSTLSAAAVNGVATFSKLILDTAGSYILSATSGSLTAAKSTSITVNAAAATKLVIAQAPTSGTAGTALSPTLQIKLEDQFGNVATSNMSAVTVAAASGPASVAGASTASVAAVNGVATFSNLIFNTAGTYTVKVSDGSLTTATSGNITISAAAASKLVFTQTPATGTAGKALSPAIKVSVEDAYGNVVTSNTSKITLVVNSGPNGFTSGSTVTVAAVSGVATFSKLLCDNAGSYLIGASDGSLTTATSGSITIAPAAASKLVVIAEPDSGTAGQALGSVQIAVEDQFGNIVTSNTSTLTVAISSGAGAFATSATMKVAAVNGIATFSNLILATKGVYKLKVSDGSLTSVTTQGITVVA